MLTNRIACLLSTTLLFTFPVESNVSPFQTEQSIEKQIDLNGVVRKNSLGFIEHPIFIQFEKDKEELEKKKAEEQQIKLEHKKNEPEWQEFILTFYTSLDMENGYGAITSQGKRLSRGGVANNVIPQNTKIYLDKWGEVTVNDKGSNKHFSVDYRLDVFIEKEPNESNKEYSRRVNSYGVQKVKGYIIKE
jgi:3D (Asp-Asp-Asp) domain-containing protein